MRQPGTTLPRNWTFLLVAVLLACSVRGYLFSADTVEATDPVARNGPIFVDWPRPQVALIFSGEMDGFLEPCGCAGLENQLGGLQRRHTLIKQLEGRGWPVVPLDMGGQVRRIGPQAEVKYRYALESLIKLDYAAIGFGARDLRLNSDALLFVLANLDPEKSPLVSANVGLFGADSPFSKKYKVIEAGGKRIGVTSVLGRRHLEVVKNSADVTWVDPSEALQNLMPTLEAEQCDLLVLLVHADPDEATALAQQFPQFQLVATTGGAEVPPKDAREIKGSAAQLIEVGEKGMYVIVLGVFDDPQQPFRFQKVPLDHRFEDSAEMQAMLVAYQEELKGTGLDGLGITGVKNPAGEFVGSSVCADCHAEATEVFETTPHAHATETLLHLDPPRHFDPECLSCHVTGWNPQEYFPYASGFFGMEKTPHLTGNGCENCHGPGGAHAAAEGGEEEVSDEVLEQLRATMRLKIEAGEGSEHDQKIGAVEDNCLKCHDVNNSPEFDFKEYWPQVEHTGKY